MEIVVFLVLDVGPAVHGLFCFGWINSKPIFGLSIGISTYVMGDEV